MKELLPLLALGLVLALAAVLVGVLRVRLGRLAEALGADLTWRGFAGRRADRSFSYCSGGQYSRPRISVLEVPADHALVALSRDAAGRFGARAGLEREVAGLEPRFDAAVAVFSADEAFVRTLFARPEARRTVAALLEGSRDRLVLADRCLALELCSSAGRRLGLPLRCRSAEQLSAGLDRLIELAPHVAEVARRAPEPRVTWRRKLRYVGPAIGAIVAALCVAAAVIFGSLAERGG